LDKFGFADAAQQLVINTEVDRLWICMRQTTALSDSPIAGVHQVVMAITIAPRQPWTPTARPLSAIPDVVQTPVAASA